MSVIIRLQGLPWTANALDIRQYFAGLTIPEGGVHIVGGDEGDAFIAFSSDEDARQAMLMDGGRIKETAKVKLMLSSRTEMQRVIDVARNRNLVMQGLLAAAAAATSTSPAAAAASSSSAVNVGLNTSMTSATPSAAAKQVTAAELFMNRAAAMMPVGHQQQMQMQQPFQLQQLKLSTMEMLQGDMRQLMMQNMGLQQAAGGVVGGGGGNVGPGAGGGAQSMLPNVGSISMGMSSSPSYEPTKKSTAIGDRDQLLQRVEAAERDLAARERDREREREREQRDQRDRSDNLNNNNNSSSRSRWTSRNDRRGSRSPRRRSRDRDGGGGSSSSRRRSDRRRSVSRGRSLEKSNDRSRTTTTAATSSSTVAATASRSSGGSGIDPFVNDLRNDVDNRRSSRTTAAAASSAPSDTGGPLNGSGGVGGGTQAMAQLSSSDSPMPSARWEGAQVLDLEPTSDNMSIADRMQMQQQSSAVEMRSWDRDLIDQPPQMFRENLGPRIGLPFNVRQQQMAMPPGVAGNNNNNNNSSSDRRMSLCVVMRGIPFDTHPLAIRDYFQGLNIPPEGVRLLIDTIGNRPHLAFIRFTNEFDRDIVLKRLTHYFQGLLVEVLPCTEEEFLRIPPQQQQPIGGAMGSEIDVWSPRGSTMLQQHQRPQYNHQMMDEENCLFVKGMPFKCTEKDIYEFFDGFRIVDALVEYLRPGKSAGTGFAEFGSPLEARRALELDGQKMDFRNIELRLSTKESMMTARRQTDENLDGGRMSIDRPFPPQAPPIIMTSAASNNNNNNNNNDLFGRFDCCLITGLPLSATDRDILEFFAPADLAPVVIHVMLDTASRPMGDAFCEFNNPHECQMAVQMDGRPLRNTPAGAKFLLRIRPVSRMELNAALGAISMGPPTGGGGGVAGPMSGLSVAPSVTTSPSIGAAPNNQRSNGGPLNAAANKLSPNQTLSTGPLSGAIPSANNGTIVSSPVTAVAAQLSSPGKQVQHLTPNIPQRPIGPSFFGRPSEPGCILEVQNLPFLSTSDDILQHFKGYGLTKESIMRRFRENGAPTGDARLLFHNPKDTQLAYRHLNSVMMGGRVLNLKILS